MTDTHYMRLSGHSGTFALTSDAHQQILDYIAASRERLRGSLDADETVRDLEVALGERLSKLAPPPGQAVGTGQVADVLDALGSVEPEVMGSQETGTAQRGPFWCRILEHKWFAGVCVGIATRGSFDLGWVRTISIFLIPLSGGLVVFAYLALALFLPVVPTVAEYWRLTEMPATRLRAGQRRRGRLRA